MAIYTYKGLTSDGKEVKSSITCDGVSVAKQKIRSQGIMLLDIKEQTHKSQSSSKIRFGNSVPIADLSLMTRQLATLLKAKVQIVDALSALTDQIDNDTLRLVISEVKQKVSEGTSLSNALADYPKIFNHIFVNMVDAGEASGTLEVVLVRLAEFTEAQVKLKNKVKGAMTYPMIMGIFGVLMINVIFIFVIPKLTKVFVSLKKELPIQTQVCIWISNFLQEYWYILLLGIFFVWFVIQRYISSQSGQRKWHRLQLRLPIFGELVKMINISRFCSTLATLLQSGVPIIASMNIVKNLIPNVLMKEAIEDARDSVKEGSSISAPLAKSGHFPPMVTHMIALGEKSGEMEDMLTIIADNYEDQVESKLSGLTSTLEPIMMVGLGLAVAFIVFSVVVPMMELNSVK